MELRVEVECGAGWASFPVFPGFHTASADPANTGNPGGANRSGECNSDAGDNALASSSSWPN